MGGSQYGRSRHNGGVNIRRAEPTDAQPIAEVNTRTWQDAYRGLMPQDYLDNLDVERRRVAWEGILAGTDWPRTGAFVAASGDEVIGFAAVCPARDEDASGAVGEVASIYVLASAWGTAVGQALMAAAVSALREALFTEATLWVLDTNTRARRFYERGGWTVDGAERLEELRGFPVREVRYRRPLG